MTSRSAFADLAVLPLAIAVTGMATIFTAAGATAGGAPCRHMVHEGARYTVCSVKPTETTIKLAWLRPDGLPYGLLSRLPRRDATTGKPLLFAANGGMFHADLKPVGLYVENRRQLAGLNTRKGPGNFHLLPNGVFYLAGTRAGVLETRAYYRSKPKVDFATQSGPMLVIGGKLHPLFVRAAKSRKMRDGVGVDTAGGVVFAISDEPVSFAQFGRLFRDGLKCPNALFLDGGSAPALYAPGTGHTGNLLPLGPMLAVYAR